MLRQVVLAVWLATSLVECSLAVGVHGVSAEF
jgi:hypothetical protein